MPPVREPVVSTALREAMAELRESALWVARSTTPFVQYEALFNGDADRAALRDMEALRTHYETAGTAEPWGPVDDVRRYHRALERAVSIAGGAADVVDGGCTDAGRVVADHARAILLDEVGLPSAPRHRRERPRRAEGAVAGWPLRVAAAPARPPAAGP